MRLAKSPLAFRDRLQFIQALILVLFVGVGLSYYRIQILNHDHFRVLGERFRVKKRQVKASRGLIYDRHEQLITRNLPAYDLVLMRDEMKEQWAQLKPRLAEFLSSDEAVLDATYQSYRSRLLSLPIVLEKDISFPEVVRVLRNRALYPGINVDVSSRRDYVYASLLSHVLGYVGEVTESDMAQSSTMRLGDIVGKRGIERAYDGFLTGHDGQRTVQMNSRGFFFSDTMTLVPESGSNLFLTLDIELQETAAQALDSHNGAVLMMDLRSGEILVYVSAPSFDLNQFARRMSEKDWNALLRQPNQPLFNRPIQGLYAPGSIFKIVTALAALDAGVITPETTFFCGGAYEYYGRTFKCASTAGHGVLDLKGAIQKSCNLYIYQVADQLTAQKIAAMAEKLGFGRETGVDLIGEKRGLVPSPTWKKERYGKVWFPGETLSMAIGQGDLQVTPIQLLYLMAVVANNGEAPVPRLLHKVERGGAMEPVNPTFHQVAIPKAYFQVVKEGMWRAVNREQGTGSAAALVGRDVCGKTGTAQLVTFRSDKDRKNERLMNAWFAGFAPRDRAEVAVVVVVEHGGGGGVNAAPVAREVLEAYFSKQKRLSPI